MKFKTLLVIRNILAVALAAAVIWFIAAVCADAMDKEAAFMDQQHQAYLEQVEKWADF